MGGEVSKVHAEIDNQSSLDAEVVVQLRGSLCGPVVRASERVVVPAGQMQSVNTTLPIPVNIPNSVRAYLFSCDYYVDVKAHTNRCSSSVHGRFPVL
jgi:hypothetical protein